MELNTTISVGASLLSFAIIVFIIPLIRYVVTSKDRQIDEIKMIVDRDRKSRCDSDERVRMLEMQIARIGIELEVARGIQVKLDGISVRVEDIAREMSSVQTSIAFLAKGRLNTKQTHVTEE